ncbi:polysaccharide pyruvyl transferase family protein [Acinetobacter sp. ANC 5414]|uniref:polysaccharide pyruvyl transferase family protein n=1 Tax=Acinetobacter sp. ANC 5414 TaxID=2731251 RepID=UPI00148FB3CB|nr:polysaccharide pyruvyl transferase family protein [Acinetobacter sp. ANC 5414]NNH02257.1 polysaccharide pyruvyl transferase family protein [Acinetobacter sp. ANC 5414]
MKIAYFINTFKSTNWGGQATSTGIRHLLKFEYPHAEFVPLDLPDLPFKKLKLLRSYYEKKLLKALIQHQHQDILYFLEKMNIPEQFFDDFTHVCFNGEGAVHYKSGHLVRFLGLLYLAKYKNKKVASINQTVDLNNQKALAQAIVGIYGQCDFVSVREPLSYDYLKHIGLEKTHLIPDAVYGLPMLKEEFIQATLNKFGLKHKQFITMTGSSFLERDAKSVKFMKNIVEFTFKNQQLPIVFLSNAKTDLYLIKKIIELNSELKNHIQIVSSDNTHFNEVMALIAGSCLLVGGRQHPNIFAFIYKTPYLPFDGNTFKNLGVAKLQEYQIEPLKWDCNLETFSKKMHEALALKADQFKDVRINEFKIFE